MSQAFTSKKIKRNVTAKCRDSEPVVYQTKNSKGYKITEIEKKPSSKQVKTILFNPNHRDVCVIMNGIRII